MKTLGFVLVLFGVLALVYGPAAAGAALLISGFTLLVMGYRRSARMSGSRPLVVQFASVERRRRQDVAPARFHQPQSGQFVHSHRNEPHRSLPEDAREGSTASARRTPTSTSSTRGSPYRPG